MTIRGATVFLQCSLELLYPRTTLQLKIFVVQEDPAGNEFDRPIAEASCEGFS